MRALAVLAVLLSGSIALACPTCGAATDTKGTYQAMTAVMSLLPLLMMGGVIGFIAFRVRRAEREALAPPPQPPPPQ
ncbi:MAG: hypothetical protein H6Q89_879 [Myxococcaceae bacterium]|nr:hypothetical protein [Myxococcaceae bacterium]